MEKPKILVIDDEGQPPDVVVSVIHVRGLSRPLDALAVLPRVAEAQSIGLGVLWPLMPAANTSLCSLSAHRQAPLPPTLPPTDHTGRRLPSQLEITSYRYDKSWMEPPPGLEPGTCALRMRCSTTELGWRGVMETAGERSALRHSAEGTTILFRRSGFCNCRPTPGGGSWFSDLCGRGRLDFGAVARDIHTQLLCLLKRGPGRLGEFMLQVQEPHGEHGFGRLAIGALFEHRADLFGRELPPLRL